MISKKVVNIHDSTENIKRPLQVITLAHAARHNNTTQSQGKNVLLPLIQNKDPIKLKVKDVINKHKFHHSEPPKSHVSSGRIYSKVATRKRSVEAESDGSTDSPDLSYLRSLKLHPWVNKLNQRRRNHLTQLDRVVEEMKERCAQMGMNSQQATPKKYKSCEESDKEKAHLKWRDENSLDFEEESSAGIGASTSSSHEDPEPNFVWNPVIENNDKYTNFLSCLDNMPDDSPCSARESVYDVQELRNVRYVHEISLYSSYDHPSACPTPSSSSGSTFAEEAQNMEHYIEHFNPRRVPTTMWFPTYSEDE